MTTPCLPRNTSCYRHGFSLIEMLVSIAVIIALAMIVFTAVDKSRNSSLRVKNASNLRAIGLASLSYAADHQGVIPLITYNGAWRIASGYGMWTISAPFKLIGENFKPGSMITEGASYIESADIFYGPFTPAFNERRAPPPSGFYEYTPGAMYLGYVFYSLPPEDAGVGEDKRSSPGVINGNVYEGHPRAPIASDLWGEAIVASAGGVLQPVSVVHLDGSISTFPVEVHFLGNHERIRYFAGLEPDLIH